MNAPFADIDRRRLIQLIGMTGSAHDGEALNALRLAQKLVAKAQLTLVEALANGVSEDELKRLAAAYERAYQKGYEDGVASIKPRGWPAFVEQCLSDHPERLTDWETDFCESFIERRWTVPTPKQRAIFDRIADKCGVVTP